jgi:hypothetical protein
MSCDEIDGVCGLQVHAGSQCQRLNIIKWLVFWAELVAMIISFILPRNAIVCTLRYKGEVTNCMRIRRTNIRTNGYNWWVQSGQTASGRPNKWSIWWWISVSAWGYMGWLSHSITSQITDQWRPFSANEVIFVSKSDATAWLITISIAKILLIIIRTLAQPTAVGNKLGRCQWTLRAWSGLDARKNSGLGFAELNTDQGKSCTTSLYRQLSVELSVVV